MEIQWYPGHMTKARRAMKEDLKQIDLLIEVVDARVPVSSRNPDLDELGRNKARLLLLNKADLADENGNAAWKRYFERQGYTVVEADSRSTARLKKMNGAVAAACREKTERDRKRGIIGRPIRAMVVGIPNVGKSTFINSFAGRACAKTGNQPGVTKGNQWIRLNRSLELLDTPGLLWPKFDDSRAGLHLALIGSINDRILDKRELAEELISFLTVHYPRALKDRYGVESQERREEIERQEQGERREQAERQEQDKRREQVEMSRENRGESVLEQVARARGCLGKGGAYDCERAAALLLDDYRGGRLGRITLELPPEDPPGR